MDLLLEVDRETKHELKTILSQNNIKYIEIFQESITLIDILEIPLATIKVIEVIYKWVQKKKMDKPNMVVNIRIEHLILDIKNTDLEHIKKEIK